MQLKVNRNQEAVADRSGGQFIGASGIYHVVLDFVSLVQSEKGAVSFNLNIDYKGNKQTIYGNTIVNTDGNTNKIGWDLFNKLLVIAGMPDGAELATETEIHNVGKDNKPTEFNVVTDLSGLEIQLQVKEVWSVYNGDIKQYLEIYNFFDSTGASASELLAYETDKSIKKGEQLAKMQANPATSQPLYRGNKGTNEPAPTPEQVEAFKANRKSGNSTPKPAVTAPKANLFSKK